MASAGDLWSLAGPTNQKTMSSGTRSGTSSGSETSNVSGGSSSSSFGFSSGTNTPQFALDALQQLIDSFFPSSKLSPEELDRLAPLPDRNSDQYTVWRTDANGNRYRVYFNQDLYNTDLASAQAKRDEVLKQAGTNPGLLASGNRASQQEQASIKGRQAGYSKEAAFNDAGNLSARFMRQLLEGVMPQLNRAVEASGTSGGAVAGLLSQDAAQRVAESQAALGLQTAVQYGQISNQMDQLLAQLAATGNPALNQLIQILNTARGTIDQHISVGSQTNTEDKSITGNKNVNENTTQTGFVSPNLYGAGTTPSIMSMATPVTGTSGTVTPNVASQNSTDVDRLLAALDMSRKTADARASGFSF